jgi:type VI secretion system VgrG family protein
MLAYLKLSSDYRIYQDETAPDVASAVYVAKTSNTMTKALSGTYRPSPLTVQFAETDLNLFSRLLEYSGIFYFFRHEDALPGLVLGDSYSAYLAAPSASVRYYGNFPTNPHPTEECLRTFHKAARAATGRAALTGYDFTAPRKNLLASSSISARPEETFEYEANVSEVGAMNELARLRLEAQQVAHTLATAAGNAPDLRPGYKFTLDDQSGSGVGGSYVVTAVRHAAFRRTTNGVTSFYYGNEVEVFPALQPYRPARKTPRPVVPACTAVVVGKAGEEIWTDRYGRVKVQFHWDRYGEADETASGWVRVASPWAGKNWGAIFVPRIGQEVLVEFVNGDPDQPVITGSFYNGDQMPPYNLPANATVSGIRTRSSKGGTNTTANEIRFEDKKGDEALDITGERNLTLVAKHDLQITASNNLTITSLRGLGINTTNNPALALNINGALGASTFQGSGAGLSSLPAAALTGLVNDANLSLNIARVNFGQTFTANNAFLGRMSVGGAMGLDTLNIHGTARLYNNDLFLRDGTDLNHGLGWRGDWKPFAGLNPDGPVLFGCAGGALGTACNSEKMALKWDWSGRVGIDPHSQNTGTLSSNALTFGASQTEGLASARSGSANLNGLDFFTAGANRLAITAAGLVGIGINNPSHLLQLHSSSSGNLLRLTGPGVNYSGGKFNFGDGEYVYLHEVSDDIFRIQANRTGIGRTPATNRFEVEGDASKTTAGGWIANSDARIKQDIEPVRDARAVLDQVRPVSFRYTDEYRKEHPGVADRRYLNVLAQEFREVFPNHVKPSGERLPDGSEILQVDTYPLTIYSAAAIRELNQDLAAKDAKIRELEQRLAALEKLVPDPSK